MLSYLVLFKTILVSDFPISFFGFISKRNCSIFPSSKNKSVVKNNLINISTANTLSGDPPKLFFFFLIILCFLFISYLNSLISLL